MFAEIENLKNRYRTECANSGGFGFSYEENNYRQGDIGSLIRGFFDDIMLQFMNTERKRATTPTPRVLWTSARTDLSRGAVRLVMSSQ